MISKQHSLGAFLTLLVGICIISSGTSSHAKGGQQLSNFCRATIDPDSGQITYDPPGCNLWGTNSSTGSSNSGFNGGSSGTNSDGGSSNSSTTATSSTGTTNISVTTGGDTTGSTTSTSSTGTTNTSTNGIIIGIGEEEEEEQLPEEPETKVKPLTLTCLSWTAQDIAFELGFTDQSNFQVTEVNGIQLKIDRKHPHPVQTTDTVCDWVNLDPWVTGDTPSLIKRKIRLDSTYFTNNSELIFRFRFSYKWKKKELPNNTWSVEKQETNKESADVRSAFVRNNVLTFATQKPATNSSYINSNFTYGETAVKGMPKVRTEISKGNFYSSFPGPFPALSFILDRSQIIDGIQNPEKSTAVIGMTHGSYNGFWDKNIPLEEGTPGGVRSIRYKLDRMIYMSDQEPKGNAPGYGIAAQTIFSARPALHPVNAFILYACESGRKNIDGVTDRLAKKTVFTTAAGTADPPNRFALGFEDLVHSNVVRTLNEIPAEGLNVSTQYNLCDHATVLIRNLREGLNVLDSLQEANTSYVTLTSNAPRTYSSGNLGWYTSIMSNLKHGPMVLQGDPDALWRGLYIKDIKDTKPRIDNSPTNKWLYLYQGRG